MEDLSTARAQAAFYASPRRFSYGWPGANDMASQHPYDTPAKIRLSTSPSYSDLSGVNMSGRGYAQDPLESSHSPTSPCQHYQQQGFCSMGDQCSYTHSTCSYPIMPGILSSNNSVSSDVSTTNTSSNFNSHSINSLHSHSNSNSNSNSSSNSNNNNSSSNSNNNNSSSNSNNTTTNSSNNNSNSSSYTTIATPPPPHGMTSSHSGSVGFSPGLPFTTPLYQHYGNSPMMTGSVPCSFSFSPLNAAMYPLAASLTDKRYTPMTHLEPDLHYTSPPQQRRSVSTDPEPNRFSGASLADFQGSLYEICKDQNGCRFLQKKLEESSGQHLELIFNEIHSHFVELMTDPFGNYLCQKLLERCSNAQRGKIVTIIAPELLSISLNMHGTRAVQKLIEFLITPEQIQTVTAALAPNVVALIKDLNGNHVIQKCLHRLSAEHNQFIYDAVSASCIKVATHRHGCCVLQRCIDHAAPSQKEQLVSVITFLALPLVQDPFGNYVVQYVLDLGDVQFSDGLVRRFLDHVCDLSVQKFSSNVIEKCIRVSEPDTRRLLIAELATKTNMEQLLRDSFANYVVQTCLDYADPDQRLQLVECIRPLLPLIRSTPYGKRIYGKIQRESQGRRQRQHPLLHTMASMRHHEERSVGAVEYDDALPVSLNYSIGRVDAHPLYTHP
ncbi:armadillo-type protein [Spinellus fusiger]|nr:armadillo-type protein [Spinellus fusiger]